MAITTYEPIQSYTLTGLTTTVTFSSIPDTYTDLRLICSYKLGTSATGTNSFVRLNGDTGTNYSNTQVIGTGSSTPSGSSTNQNNMGVTVDLTSDYAIYKWDFQNYADTTSHKSVLLRQDAANQVAAGIYLWRNTNAINQISFTAADNSGGASGTPDQFAAGSTFTLYGIKSTDSSSSTAKATGGTITTDMNYTYHTFTAGGTFTPSQNLTADVLMVGGGGGSGDANAGGGGAGGVIYAPTRSLTSGTGYTVTIGAGGGANANGQASTFDGLSATGGGYSIGEGSSGTNGGSGGGGGGGGGSNVVFAPGISTGSSGAGYTFYGNSGGPGFSNYNAGGGGGAGAAGDPARGKDPGSGGGNGGVGLATWSSWLTATNTGHNVSGTRYIAGGGGGGANSGPVGTGGLGGGGTGKSDSSSGSQTPGTANTGGGAGGSGGISSRGGTNGGSGLVIIRYLKS